MNLRQLSVNDGLSWYQVTDIEQDAYGFVWIATYDGLNRYDGVGCKVYRYNPMDSNSLSSNRVKSLMYDAGNNRMLIGTDGGGINVYDYSSDSFRTVNIGSRSNEWLPENDIIDIKPEKDGRLWVATRQTIYLVEIDGTGVSIIQSISYSQRRVLNSLVSMDGMLIAVARMRAIRYVYRNGAYEKDADAIFPENANVNSVYYGTDGRLWFCTDKGVFYIKDPAGTFSYQRARFEGAGLTGKENVTTLNETDEGLYFVVGGQGLYFRQNDGFIQRIVTLNDDFWMANPIKKSIFDKSGILWMASHNKGVGFMSLDQTKFGRIVPPEKWRPMFVTALMANPADGTLWIGTQNDGLYVYDKEKHVRNFFSGAGRITDIKKFSDGSVNVVCNGHIYSYKNGHFNEIFPFPSDVAKVAGTVFNICETSSGIIVSGCRKGVVITGKGNCQYIKMETAYYRNVILSSHCNAFWVCSSRSGLSMISLPLDESAKVEHSYTRTSADGHVISSNNVMTVFEASDKRIYVGTDMGLDMIDPLTHRTFSLDIMSKTLSSCRVLAIQEDSRGMLWINTQNGIVRYDPKTGKESIYDVSDGLISNYATESSILVDDVLYAGMSGGVSFFHTNIPNADMIPPDIAVSGFSVNGQELHFDRPVMDMDHIVLAHDQNNITFNLNIFSFGNPDKNRYLYRLAGYDDDWHNVGAAHPYASYSKLKKGHYCFEFKGVAWNGAESVQTKRVNVTVRAAWWDSTFAWCIYALLFAAALYSTIVMEKQRIRQRAKNEVAEAKLKFYDNLTHEFRTPLTLIAAPLAELTAMENLPEEVCRRLNLMRKNSDRLTGIVNNFLCLRKVDNKGLSLIVKYQDISLLVTNIVHRFEPLAKQKNILLSVSAGEQMFGWADEDKINIILTNLLSNAIKFTASGGMVSVALREDKSCYVIDVKDNGRGISDNNLARIFERFYQEDRKSVSGTGIGLELSRSLAELHKGSLSVTSILGEGSTFTLSIPYMKSSYTETEISDVRTDEIVGDADAGYPEELSVGKDNSIKILVVEDDMEMSEYIRSILSQEYQVIVAENGKTGFEAAINIVPDLIVSDVMMPEIDGIEMCRLLMEDRRTSHIPVIMLTAKDDEYEGLRSGAVDYIMKPFMPQNLLLKIRNMLRWRSEHSMSRDNVISVQKRIQEYGEQKEKEFLQQAFDVVEKNIVNSQFSVEDFSVELGVSKTQLHKKLTALTGASASAFIRNIRLDKGREMLETGRYSISEVLYSVGFSSPSYFSKKFSERFGKLPSDLIHDK